MGDKRAPGEAGESREDGHRVSRPDPLALVHALLTARANSREQEEAIERLQSAFYLEPSTIPLLFSTLLPLTLGAEGDTVIGAQVGAANTEGAASSSGKSTRVVAGLLRKWSVGFVSNAVAGAYLDARTLSSIENLEVRTGFAVQAIEKIAQVFSDAETNGDVYLLKAAMVACTSIYPLLLRHFAINPKSEQSLANWNIITALKSRILELAGVVPEKTTTSDGLQFAQKASVQIVSTKFVQKVIATQTRLTVDPRRAAASTSAISDIALNVVPSTHPTLRPRALEEEANYLLEHFLLGPTRLYGSDTVAVKATMTVLAPLAKARPSTATKVVRQLADWTPLQILVPQMDPRQAIFSALKPVPTGKARYTMLKSLERTLRLALSFLQRALSASQPQIVPIVQEAIQKQHARLDAIEAEEIERRGQESKGKRAAILDAAEGSETKRQRTLEPILQNPSTPSFGQALKGGSENPLASFDVTTLPINLVVELIIANLEFITQDRMVEAVAGVRRNMAPTGEETTLLQKSIQKTAPLPASRLSHPSLPTKVQVSQAISDPLKREMDEDELEFKPDEINATLKTRQATQTERSSFSFARNVLGQSEHPGNGVTAGDAEPEETFESVPVTLPDPEIFELRDRMSTIKSALARMFDSGLSMMADEPDKARTKESNGVPASHEEIIPLRLTPRKTWMLIVSRLVTRSVSSNGVEANGMNGDVDSSDLDEVRDVLFQFIKSNFRERSDFASIWLAEEFYNRPGVGSSANSGNSTDAPESYSKWLDELVVACLPRLTANDRFFTDFVLGLPHITSTLMSQIRNLCTNNNRMPLGIRTLSELVILRPPVREQALDMLLELSTHRDKVTRNAAIITLKKWVPDRANLTDKILDFAGKLLRKLATNEEAPVGSPTTSDLLFWTCQDPGPETGTPEKEVFSNDDGVMPISEIQVQQHIELVLALCSKQPTLLDEIIAVYPRLSPFVQKCTSNLITQLVRSLGPESEQLRSFIAAFRPGTESLVLKVIKTFEEQETLDAWIRQTVQRLTVERDLPAVFLIPLMPYYDKASALASLARLVSILQGVLGPAAATSGTQERKLVRDVLVKITIRPDESFGGGGSNLPREELSKVEGQGAIILPTELMLAIHQMEDQVGLKKCIEAIQICFGMTSIFRAEVVASAIQMMVDQPKIPTLFMRTVLQAITQHPSLVAYVSQSLLPSLVVKKIWTQTALWEGFQRAVKMTSPHSIPAVLSLPREKMMEMITKPGSADVMTGVRDYVAGQAKGRPLGDRWNVLLDSIEKARAA